MRIAKFYAQKFSFCARKLLVGARDSAIIDLLARASALDRRPRTHLAVGSGQEIAEVSARTCRKVGFSGRCGWRLTVRAASRRAPRACPTTGRRAPPAQAGHGAGSQTLPSGRGWRLVGGAMRGVARRAGPFTGPAPGEGGVPPGRRRRWGQAHPLSSQGAGSGSSRGVSGARKGALAPLCVGASAAGPQRRRCAARASPRCRPWRARSPARPV